MLGLTLDLSNFGKQGFVKINHTTERRKELVETIDLILESGVLTSKDAERLRGRMIFFEGYTSGRIANASVGNLGCYCTNTSKKTAS